MLKGFGFWPSYDLTMDMPEFEDLALSEELKNMVGEDQPRFLPCRLWGGFTRLTLDH